MPKSYTNHYKTCRENAGLTQVKASELLHVCERSMSDYERGKVTVPDNIVDKMSEIYNAPLLAWWHIKEHSVLGKYLPDLHLPSTDGDMAFQLILADDELESVVLSIKKIMSNGKVDDEEEDDYKKDINKIKRVNGKLMSIVAYAEQQKAVMS